MSAPDLLRCAAEGTLDFAAQLSRLKKRGESDLASVEPAVREIITAV